MALIPLTSLNVDNIIVFGSKVYLDGRDGNDVDNDLIFRLVNSATADEGSGLVVSAHLVFSRGFPVDDLEGFSHSFSENCSGITVSDRTVPNACSINQQ